MDEVQETLRNISVHGSDGISDDQLKEFKKRKLISNMSVDHSSLVGGFLCAFPLPYFIIRVFLCGYPLPKI